MTADIELLPLPAEDYVDDEGLWEKRHGPYIPEQMEDYARACVAHATAAQDAEIERLRADKSDLEAALEYLKAHKENAAMNQDGIIKALSEARDEQGAEIHRLRAELKIAKGQAEFYRTTRNWNQQKAERLAEALLMIESAKDRGFGIDYARGVAQSALRDHDQEARNG